MPAHQKSFLVDSSLPKASWKSWTFFLAAAVTDTVSVLASSTARIEFRTTSVFSRTTTESDNGGRYIGPAVKHPRECGTDKFRWAPDTPQSLHPLPFLYYDVRQLVPFNLGDVPDGSGKQYSSRCPKLLD